MDPGDDAKNDQEKIQVAVKEGREDARKKRKETARAVLPLIAAVLPLTPGSGTTAPTTTSPISDFYGTGPVLA